MNYAIIKNDVVETYPYTITQLKADNPQTSFPQYPSNELLASYDMYPVLDSIQPSYDALTQTLVEGTPIQSRGDWVQVWIVDPLPEDQARANNKSQAAGLLSQTDWTTIPDVANPAVSNPYLLNQAEFVRYRNQIRKIAVYPPVAAVVWPVCPDEIWSS